MKLPCSVTRDLMPLYAEKMVEAETVKLMEEHLAECPACRQKLAEIETETGKPVDTIRPLEALRKELRKRRGFTALMAALCVFLLVFTWACHRDRLEQVPWTEGLITVKGVGTRPSRDVFAAGTEPTEKQETVDVLVLRLDNRINATQETLFRDDDGTSTLLLQGWSSSGNRSNGETNEMVFCPVPDRLFYSGGGEQKLLWGTEMNGGVEVLPRLVLAWYALIAAVLSVVLGLLWLLFRRRACSGILCQLFLAPLSYLTAQFLIKGLRTTTFFLMRDLLHILVAALALYTLLTLAFQMLRKKKTV